MREILPGTEKENLWLEEQIDQFNRNQLSFIAKHVEIPKNYVIKENSNVIAGIKSCFYLEEVLSIGLIFVAEGYRHKGLGTALLNKVESEAKSIGGKLAHLYTFDFQAKDFYLKRGYQVFAALENCPTGHTCYYLKKEL